jgi:3-mercaptopyruvate sulfurtransferase SseA
MAPHIETRQAVLVSTDWVAEHIDDRAVRLIEVDVDTAAYDSGHIRGAVGWDWRRDLQRRPVRDIPAPASATTPRSYCTETTTTGSPLSHTGCSSSTATRTPVS